MLIKRAVEINFMDLQISKGSPEEKGIENIVHKGFSFADVSMREFDHFRNTYQPNMKFMFKGDDYYISTSTIYLSLSNAEELQDTETLIIIGKSKRLLEWERKC